MIREFNKELNKYVYRGTSGAIYQYDLNNTADNLAYQTDFSAQMRDKANFNPFRETEKGGGILFDATGRKIV